jgi:hypothetical protein
MPLNSFLPILRKTGDFSKKRMATQKCMSAILSIERILWFIVDILIQLIVGAVCTKQVVTAGGNAL